MICLKERAAGNEEGMKAGKSEAREWSEGWERVDIPAECDALIAWCEARLGGGEGPRGVRVRPAVRPLKRFVVEVRELPGLPVLRSGTLEEFARVARLRNLPHADGPALASRHGTLRFCTIYDQPAWVVLDVENPCNVQPRRMDGKLWFGKTKVMGITGNWAGWPVGLAVALRLPQCVIWLVEGGGDFIAAWHCAAEGWGNFVPVAMTGASQAIHAGALPLFSGRRVVIVQQNDAAGAVAAVRWRDQLEGAGAVVTIRAVPGEGMDLNDWVTSGGVGLP